MIILNKVCREIKKIMNRKKLKNKSFTLLTNNCLGGVIYHDLGLPFNSPLINLWMYPKDFIKFCSNLDYYLSIQIFFIKENGINYPVGKLDDITLYFQHYKSEKEANLKWENRKKRINFENMFIVLVEKDGCTYNDLANFDKLSFENKVVFTHRKYPKIFSSYQLIGFENDLEVGNLFKYQSKFSGKKYYDQFPFIDWFNKTYKNRRL